MSTDVRNLSFAKMETALLVELKRQIEKELNGRESHARASGGSYKPAICHHCGGAMRWDMCPRCAAAKGGYILER